MAGRKPRFIIYECPPDRCLHFVLDDRGNPVSTGQGKPCPRPDIVEPERNFPPPYSNLSESALAGGSVSPAHPPEGSLPGFGFPSPGSRSPASRQRKSPQSVKRPAKVASVPFADLRFQLRPVVQQRSTSEREETQGVHTIPEPCESIIRKPIAEDERFVFSTSPSNPFSTLPPEALF